MPFAKSNGAEIYYEEQGQGFPLVLSHSGWGDVSSWASQLPEFSQRYRTIAYDRRGCGQSTKVTEGAHSPDLWVEDLYNLLRHLNIDETYLCGISYGGMVTLEFLLKHQDLVRAAVLGSTTSSGYRSSRPPVVPFPDRTEELRNIHLPCMVVHGSQDAGFPLSLAHATNSGITNSDMVVLDAGHSIHRDKPAEFNKTVLDFFRKVELGTFPER